MHTLDPALLRELEAMYGTPREETLRWPVMDREAAMIEASRRGWRSHDVTLFIFGSDGRLALIRKPFFPPGAWRAPSGGVRPDEPFMAGALREAREETGLRVEPLRYLLRVRVTFVPAGPDGTAADENPSADWAAAAAANPAAAAARGAAAAAETAPGRLSLGVPWVTHVFIGRTEQTELRPEDTLEIAGARWATPAELDGPIRAALEGAGLPLLRYRAWLHSRVLAALAGE